MPAGAAYSRRNKLNEITFGADYTEAAEQARKVILGDPGDHRGSRTSGPKDPAAADRRRSYTSGRPEPKPRRTEDAWPLDNRRSERARETGPTQPVTFDDRQSLSSVTVASFVRRFRLFAG